MPMFDPEERLRLATGMAVAILGNASVTFTAKGDVLDQLLRDCLHAVNSADAPVVPPEPEVVKPTKRAIADAVQPDSILCFEDGKRYKSMKRTLVKFGLTPEGYRVKWGLPADFPIVASNYSAHRSALAKANGLGRK